MKIITIITLFITTFTYHTFAYSDAHVHGIAYLNIILDRDKINLELFAPAVSFIGFEHSPQTKTEKSSVNSAKKTLSEPNLFSFYEKKSFFRKKSVLPAKRVSNTVDLVSNSHKDTEHQDTNQVLNDHQCDSHSSNKTNKNTSTCHHDVDKHSNKGSSCHHDTSEHSEHEHHSHQTEESHSEFKLNASFTKEPDTKVSHFSTALFTYFEDLEEVVVTLYANDDYIQHILTPNSPLLKIKGL